MEFQELHVIFGTGALASAVMRELVARGKQVRMVNRSGVADVPAGVAVVRGDASDPASAAAAAQGASIVYQCAQPPYTQWPEQFPALQAGILAGAARVGAKLVVGDNLYMYGPPHGPLTEDTPYAPTTRKGRVRAQMAEAVLEAHQKGMVRATIGRASDFYGPQAGVQGWFGDRVVPALLAGKRVSLPGNLDMPHTYSFIEDFGKGLVILGEREEALGQVWHIPNAPTRTTRDVLHTFFAEAGLPPKIGRIPDIAMRALGLINPLVREVVEMLYEFNAPFVVDHRKFVRAFGDIATPEREAVRKTLDWYRQRAAQPVPAHR